MVERREILETHLKRITLEEKVETYSPRLATLTPGFSGAGESPPLDTSPHLLLLTPTTTCPQTWPTW